MLNMFSQKAIYAIFLKNFTKMFFGKAGLKIFTVVTIIVIARFLGGEDFGRFSYLLSLAWILILFIDFGLSELLIRDVARAKDSLKKYFTSIFALKIFVVLIFIGVLGFLLPAGLLNLFEVSMPAFIFLVGSTIFDSFVDFFRCSFRAVENFSRESLFLVVESFVKFFAVLLALFINKAFDRITLICLALFFASLFNAVLLWLFSRKNFEPEFFRVDLRFWIKVIKSGFPLVLIYILSVINFRINVIILISLQQPLLAGLLNANCKLIEQIFIIPFTFSLIILPAFSRFSRNAVSKIRLIYFTLLPQLILMGLLFSLIVVISAPILIRLIYGVKYEGSHQVLYILGWMCIPLFVKPLLEKLLIAMKSQKAVILIYLSGAVINIGLVYFLFGRFNISGVAASNLVSEIIMVACLVIVTKSLLGKKSSAKTG